MTVNRDMPHEISELVCGDIQVTIDTDAGADGFYLLCARCKLDRLTDTTGIANLRWLVNQAEQHCASQHHFHRPTAPKGSG